MKQRACRGRQARSRLIRCCRVARDALDRPAARVRDDATLPGAKYPWVIRDPDKLLEERHEWIITVGDAAPPKAPIPPVGPAAPTMDPPTPAK